MNSQQPKMIKNTNIFRKPSNDKISPYYNFKAKEGHMFDSYASNSNKNRSFRSYSSRVDPQFSSKRVNFNKKDTQNNSKRSSNRNQFLLILFRTSQPAHRWARRVHQSRQEKQIYQTRQKMTDHRLLRIKGQEWNVAKKVIKRNLWTI